MSVTMLNIGQKTSSEFKSTERADPGGLVVIVNVKRPEWRIVDQ